MKLSKQALIAVIVFCMTSTFAVYAAQPEFACDSVPQNPMTETEPQDRENEYEEVDFLDEKPAEADEDVMVFHQDEKDWTDQDAADKEQADQGQTDQDQADEAELNETALEVEIFSSQEEELSEGWNYDALSRTWSYYQADEDAGKLKALSGWQVIQGSTFYFDAENLNSAATGWKTIGNEIFYFQETGSAGTVGKMVTGIQRISGKDFYFKKTGALGAKGKLVTGWITTNNRVFYAQPKGSIGKKGLLTTGLKKIGKYNYYFKESGQAGTRGMILTGEQKINKTEYCFKKTGKAGVLGRGMDGWVNLKRGRCYCSNGKILKSRYVQDYYVGSNGAMSAKSKKLYNLVKSTISKNTNSSMTKAQKLRACYNYLIKGGFRYVRNYTFKNEASWKMDCAYQMLSNKQGICYHFSSAFGFMARELGYDADIIAGKISSVSGGYSTHSWVEIEISRKNYVFDASMEHGNRGDFYKKTYAQTGRTYVKG
ncbi:hypothetical protein NXH76_26580 [Blautia schinkii]|nr:hypothetical protein [Blautia schinkii]